jgi:hypothetical protein
MKKYLFLSILLSAFCISRDSITVIYIRWIGKIVSPHFTEAKEDFPAGSVKDRSREYDNASLFSRQLHPCVTDAI